MGLETGWSVLLLYLGFPPRLDGLGFFGHTFILVVYSSSFTLCLDGRCALLMLSELCDDLDSYIGAFCVHIQNDKTHSLQTQSSDSFSESHVTPSSHDALLKK